MVVNKAENNEQVDADILQCKADILRASDIRPLGKKKTGQEPASQEAGEAATPPANAAEISAEKEKTAPDTSSIPAEPVSLEDTALLPPLPTGRVNHTDTAKQLEPEQAISSRDNMMPASLEVPAAGGTVAADNLLLRGPKAQTEQTKPAKDTAVEREDTGHEKTEIPKFDLAEEIMAEQRKITAIKRKAPGKKAEAQKPEPQVESIGYYLKQPTPALPEQERIIAEIVARDIERLCRDDYSADRG